MARFYLDSIKNIRFYNTPFILPIGEEDKKRGSATVLLTPNFTSSVKTMRENRHFVTMHYNRYYIDRTYRAKIDRHSIVDIMSNDVRNKKYYAPVKDKVDFIKVTPADLQANKGFNVFLDMAVWNNVILDNMKKGVHISTSANTYFTYVREQMDRLTQGLDNKLIVIPIVDWKIAGTIEEGDVASITRKFNPIVFFIYLLKFDIMKLKDYLKGYNVVFTGNAGYFKFDVSKIEATDGKSILSMFSRVLSACEGVMDDKDANEPVKGEAPKSSLKATKDTIAKKIEDAITPDVGQTNVKALGGKEISDKVEKAIASADLDNEEDVKNALDNDNELLTQVEKVKLEKLTGTKTKSSIKRDLELREKMMKIKVKDKSFEELLKEAEENELSTLEIQANVINENLKFMQAINFDKDYNEKEWEVDLARVVNNFTKMSIPMYVKDFKIEDTSDEFNLKQTLTIKFEDSNRKRHTVKVDLPVIYQDSYFFINGSKKNMIKQITLNPIAKIAPDTVQIATNYNKIILSRAGTVLSPKLNRLTKVLNGLKSPRIKISSGNNTIANNLYKTTIEYDILASKFMFIDVPDGDFYIGFNQSKLREELEKRFPGEVAKLADNHAPIGWLGKHIIKLDVDRDKVLPIDGINENEMSVADFIADALSDVSSTFASKLEGANPGKRFAYTSARLMKKDVPLILLMSYMEGFIPTLNKMGVKYEVMDKKPRLTPDDKVNKGIIEFADRVIMYDKYPYEHSLMLNGMVEIPTKLYNMEDFNSKDVYTDIFETLFGRRDIANSFDNFYDCLIDDLTAETLKKLNYPTKCTDVLLFANNLLVDNSYMPETDLGGSRVRGNELVMGYLYKALSDSYGRYRITSSNRNPDTVSLPQDIVLKELLMSPNVEEYSTLNPILEIDKKMTVGYKGLSGLNLDRAFTMEKRSYDESMVGNIALSTPQSAKVGVIRQLTANAGLRSTRGFFNVVDPKDIDKLDPTQLMSPAELLTPFTFNHADTPRVSMNTTQAKHTVPTKHNDRALIGNGYDKVLHGLLSDDFVFKAKGAGVVESIDDETGLMILKYKDGSKDIVKISSNVAKNSNGGFFIANKLDPTVKVGEKIIKGQVVAQNENFFSTDEFGGTSYNTGPLAKIAIAGGYATFEDSTIITNRLSEKMATDVVMKKDVLIGPNSNVDFMVSPGDKVDVGDPLIVFEESYDEEEYNRLLTGIGSDLGEDVNKFGKVPIASKYSGVIEDVKIYYTVDIDEMSPSLKKIVTAYNKKISKVKKIVDSTIPDKIERKILFDPNHKVEPYKGKIKGTTITDGIFIEFYIKYQDNLGIGDKVTFYTALKGIIGEVIEDDEAPFSEHRKEEPIDAFLGPISIAKRMTDDIKYVMFANKVLIEAKRKCKEIWNK